MGNYFSRSVTRAMSIFKGRRGTEYTINVLPEGVRLSWLTLEGESGHRRIRWEDISSVVVYKRDLYTSDMICLLCTLVDGFQFEFQEEMPCWQSLVDALPQHLPGCPVYSEWWNPVAVPAFVTNERTLFQRGNGNV